MKGVAFTRGWGGAYERRKGRDLSQVEGRRPILVGWEETWVRSMEGNLCQVGRVPILERSEEASVMRRG